MLVPFAVALFALTSCGRQAAAAFDGERALALVEEQVAFGPRIPGSQANRQMARWLQSTLSRLGWNPTVAVSEYRGVELISVVACVGDPQRGRILLGTHYDTRPRADRDPLEPNAPVPGANDGASGVAVLLELARVLAAEEDLPEIELAFFDGEDSGSLEGWEWSAGASAYAAGLERMPEAVVIIDMVGDADLRLPRERTSDPVLTDEIWAIARDLGAEAFVEDAGGSILDDHRPFLARGTPAVLIIDLQYEYWHTTGDTPDKVSAESLEQVGTVLQAWVLSHR